MLVVLEVKGQLGAAVGALDGAVAVEQGTVERARLAQECQGVCGQVGVGVSGIAGVLGGNRDGLELVEHEGEEVDGIV
jgi:hypothetical protein